MERTMATKAKRPPKTIGENGVRKNIGERRTD